MSLCATCALQGRACCSDSDVLVTEGDVRRIERATGRTDFWEFRVPDDPDNRTPYDDDPNWLDFTIRPDGTRAQLRQNQARDCIFLGAEGCTLSSEVRPLHCRLYPFDFNEQGITGTHDSCPVEFLKPGQDLLSGIGLRQEDAERCRAQLYEELRDERAHRENRQRAEVGRGSAVPAVTRVAPPSRRPLVAVLHGFVPDDAPPDELDTLFQVRAVIRSLRELGYRAEPLAYGPDPARAEVTLRRWKPAAAFNLVETIGGSCHGIEAAPRLLESLGIRWTGAGIDALAVTASKIATKAALAAAGVATPPWMAVNGNAHELPSFAGPWIVKSVWEHASVGLTDDGVVATAPELAATLERRAGAFGAPWFVERYVEGREFVVSLLAPRASAGEPDVLAICEILFLDYPAGKPRIVNYAAKWEEGSFEHRSTVRRFLSSGDDPALFARIAAIARTAWRAFGLRGYARVDFRVDDAGEPWVVDLNSNPCIAPDSGFVAAASRAGLPYDEVVRRILEAA